MMPLGRQMLTLAQLSRGPRQRTLPAGSCPTAGLAGAGRGAAAAGAAAAPAPAAAGDDGAALASGGGRARAPRSSR